MQLSSVPYDMMRYDRACPATEGDSGKLERLAHDRMVTELGGNPDAAADARTVEFLCYAPGAPTVGRWRSFGAKVLGIVDDYGGPPRPVKE